MGSSLRHVIDAHAPMRPAQAIGIALQILEPLVGLHAQGRAHGGVWPDKIRLLRDRAELDAPAGARADPRGDVFAVGCILYELLTRVPPEAAPAPPSSRTPSRLSARLDAAVMRAVDPSPSLRFANAGELLHELRVCLVDALGAAARARET
jgi:hypothetical protein